MNGAHPATYATSTGRMDIRKLPTQEMIIRDGQAIWQVCGAGMCVEDASGTRAMATFRALCAGRGITPPCANPELPCRGPDESDEPGV